MEVRSQHVMTGSISRGGSQPIALAAGVLFLILVGVGAIAIWRGYSGASPEPDRVAAARQLQAKAAQTSEQLVEKTTGLEVTQQESIDQLQVVQDQLQAVKGLLAAEQADTKRLSEQVASLTEAIDSLRQSFASVQTPESADRPPGHNKSVRARLHATRSARGKPGKTPG